MPFIENGGAGGWCGGQRRHRLTVAARYGVLKTMKHWCSAPELACAVRDGGEVIGHLVVDSFVNGRSHGGVRMHRDITEEELRLLARTMTLKYGLLGLPFGGAKAGVIGDPEAPREEKRRGLARFGRGLRPLLEREIFVPAGDMGTDLEDIRSMLVEAGIRLERRRLPAVPSGTFTAHSVFACAAASTEALGRSLKRAPVAIQGFGAVGSALAERMHKAGALVVAISTSRGALHDPRGLDVPSLVEAAKRWGSSVVERAPCGTRIDREAVHALPVEVLCPCAGVHAIHEGNAEDVSARVLCPGANNPWTPAAEEVLSRKGILLIPDFVANAGGVLGTAMSYAGFRPAEIESFVQESFRNSTRYLLEAWQRDGIPLRMAAEALVEQRRIRDSRPGSPTLPGILMSLGLRLHRRGLVPRALVRAVSRPYFRRKMTAGLSAPPLQTAASGKTGRVPEEGRDTKQVTGR